MRAFLKVYLRVVDEIKAQGPEILAPAYVRFAEAWMGKKFSEADAIAELREHPVFSLEEQLALFGEDGESPLKAWLAEIAAFSEKMNPDTAHRHARSRLGPLPQGAQVILRRHGKKAFAAFPQRAFGCGDSVSPGFPALLPGTG